PAPWNGLKLFGPDGRVLSAARGKEVQARFEQGVARHVPWDQVGVVRPYRQAEEAHCDRVLQLIATAKVPPAPIGACLDGNGGAGGPIGKRLPTALAVGTVCQGCDADGTFRHAPEPTEANLKEVSPLVAQRGCNIGFALDPDSDRLALIDEQG